MTRPNRHKASGVAAIHHGVPEKFQPFRDKSVDSRTVSCPDCGADIGDSCTNGAGAPTKAHIYRRRLAIRLLNEQLAAAQSTSLPEDGSIT